MVAVLFTVLEALVFFVDQAPDAGEMDAAERTQPTDGKASVLTRSIEPDRARFQRDPFCRRIEAFRSRSETR